MKIGIDDPRDDLTAEEIEARERRVSKGVGKMFKKLAAGFAEGPPSLRDSGFSSALRSLALSSPEAVASRQRGEANRSMEGIIEQLEHVVTLQKATTDVLISSEKVHEGIEMRLKRLEKNALPRWVLVLVAVATVVAGAVAVWKWPVAG